MELQLLCLPPPLLRAPPFTSPLEVKGKLYIAQETFGTTNVREDQALIIGCTCVVSPLMLVEMRWKEGVSYLFLPMSDFLRTDICPSGFCVGPWRSLCPCRPFVMATPPSHSPALLPFSHLCLSLSPSPGLHSSGLRAPYSLMYIVDTLVSRKFRSEHATIRKHSLDFLHSQASCPVDSASC